MKRNRKYYIHFLLKKGGVNRQGRTYSFSQDQFNGLTDKQKSLLKELALTFGYNIQREIF